MSDCGIVIKIKHCEEMSGSDYVFIYQTANRLITSSAAVPKGSATSSQEIRGYKYVMATLTVTKFILMKETMFC